MTRLSDEAVAGRVRLVHVRYDAPVGAFCRECRGQVWPCDTIRLADDRAALAAEVAALHREADANTEIVRRLDQRVGALAAAQRSDAERVARFRRIVLRLGFEHNDDTGERWCVECGELEPEHEPGCDIGVALAAAPEPKEATVPDPTPRAGANFSNRRPRQGAAPEPPREREGEAG